MLLVLFIVLNVLLAFLGRYVFHFSAFEISPAAIAILAWNGNNIVVSALFLNVAYAATGVKDLRFLWLVLPVTILVGYLALLIHNLFAIIIAYHVIGALVNYALQRFDLKYVLYMGMNAVANIMLAKIYYLF